MNVLVEIIIVRARSNVPNAFARVGESVRGTAENKARYYCAFSGNAKNNGDTPVGRAKSFKSGLWKKKKKFVVPSAGQRWLRAFAKFETVDSPPPHPQMPPANQKNVAGSGRGPDGETRNRRPWVESAAD